MNSSQNECTLGGGGGGARKMNEDEQGGGGGGGGGRVSKLGNLERTYFLNVP